jgi:hypothetical protein
MNATGPAIGHRRHIGFEQINRRTHLYSALFFLPWFLSYGLSAAIFNHPRWFDSTEVKRKLLFDRSYPVECPNPIADLRPFAERALRDSGLDGQFAVRAEDFDSVTIVIIQDRFLSNTVVTWKSASRRLIATRSGLDWRKLLTRIHTRGGFETPGFLRNLWSVIVDVVQVAMMFWIASGLYMWWRLKRYRGWGLVALGCGNALFAAFLLKL